MNGERFTKQLVIPAPLERAPSLYTPDFLGSMSDEQKKKLAAIPSRNVRIRVDPTFAEERAAIPLFETPSPLLQPSNEIAVSEAKSVKEGESSHWILEGSTHLSFPFSTETKLGRVLAVLGRATKEEPLVNSVWRELYAGESESEINTANLINHRAEINRKVRYAGGKLVRSHTVHDVKKDPTIDVGYWLEGIKLTPQDVLQAYKIKDPTPILNVQEKTEVTASTLSDSATEIVVFEAPNVSHREPQTGAVNEHSGEEVQGISVITFSLPQAEMVRRDTHVRHGERRRFSNSKKAKGNKPNLYDGLPFAPEAPPKTDNDLKKEQLYRLSHAVILGLHFSHSMDTYQTLKTSIEDRIQQDPLFVGNKDAITVPFAATIGKSLTSYMHRLLGEADSENGDLLPEEQVIIDHLNHLRQKNLNVAAHVSSEIQTTLYRLQREAGVIDSGSAAAHTSKRSPFRRE